MSVVYVTMKRCVRRQYSWHSQMSLLWSCVRVALIFCHLMRRLCCTKPRTSTWRRFAQQLDRWVFPAVNFCLLYICVHLRVLIFTARCYA